ncbi:MAG: hypothetical protein OXH76_18650 [Boseongicola sp.]|nr:hypothetical protein [Boseongicola sp.]
MTKGTWASETVDERARQCLTASAIIRRRPGASRRSAHPDQVENPDEALEILRQRTSLLGKRRDEIPLK